jgi:DNA-binding transcriptional LysR family regulator
MDLEELRVFVAVVETGSIVAAARSLNFARATLRRRLDELESRAGVPLLHRTASGAVPTEAGAILAERSRVILQEANALLSSVREVGAEPAGELRIVAPVGMPPLLMTPLLAALRRKYPALCPRLHFSNDPLAGLLDDVDVALYFGNRSPAGPWVSHEILLVQERLLASKKYLRRKGMPRSPGELLEHELLAWACPDSDPRAWPLRSGGAVQVNPGLITSDIHVLRQCAVAGLGIAFVPDAGFEDPGAPTDRLVPVLPEQIGRDRPLRFVAPAALSDIPRIRAVLTEIQTLIQEHRAGPPGQR